MSVINLAFNFEMARASSEDRKHCTSRDEPKGKPGDRFETDGTWFVLTGVLPLSVYQISAGLYMVEGFASPRECAKALREIYPDKDHNDTLYVHFYRRAP